MSHSDTILIMATYIWDSNFLPISLFCLIVPLLIGLLNLYLICTKIWSQRKVDLNQKYQNEARRISLDKSIRGRKVASGHNSKLHQSIEQFESPRSIRNKRSSTNINKKIGGESQSLKLSHKEGNTAQMSLKQRKMRSIKKEHGSVKNRRQVNISQQQQKTSEPKVSQFSAANLAHS